MTYIVQYREISSGPVISRRVRKAKDSEHARQTIRILMKPFAILRVFRDEAE